MKFLLVSIFFVVIFLRIDADIPLCVGRPAKSKPVIEYCETNNGTLKFRCCTKSDGSSITIIAVDFMEMNLTSIPDLTEHLNLFPNVVDFRSNDHIVPTSEDFLGVTNLGTLYLPTSYPCPGGQLIWNTTVNVTDPPGNMCEGQLDSCVIAGHVCWEPHSYCSTNGPNHTLCLCEGDYHGYKCLRRGNFPKGAFFGPTIAVTIVTTIALYWTTRRHVRKRQD